MEWHACPTCGQSHPWRVTADRPCPIAADWLAKKLAADGAPRKKGRPRLEDEDRTLKATQPWKAAGMSRSSWFRRRAAAAGAKR